MGKIRVKLRKQKKTKPNIRLNLDLLTSDTDLCPKYNLKVKNKFKALEEIEEVEELWQQLKRSITEAAKEEIPTKEKKTKQKWMTEDILNLMDKRRKAKGEQGEYESIHREVRRNCEEAKEAWLNEKCREIDIFQRQAPNTMYRNVEELIGKKKASSTGCLKAKNGEIIMEKDKILERWSEYIKELFDDERKEIEVMKDNFAGPPILKDEVRTAIWKMKNGKATGPDNIAAEQIKALDEFGINKITELLDEIYETGEIPKKMLKSIFIALPKKDGATECELHRTISLMSQGMKILLRIVMMRVRNKIRPEIGDTQCGFVEGKGTTNAVYMLRMIIERALEMQKDIYLCFIDYTKAFDRVKHWEMIKQLKQLHVDGKDLRIIKNIYWQQIAAVRIENEINPFQMIKRGVRQGCVLSPDLFNLYSETILRNLDEYPGIRIGGRMINNLRYADDTVLIAENKEDLQKLTDIAATESKRMGLELNSKKTEVMVINRRPNLNADLFVDGTKLKQRDSFKYLGTIITQDGKSHTDIKARIAQAKTNFQKMKPLLTNNKITITTRKRALQCYIEPILMYGCETWTITKEIQKKIEAAEMWFLDVC
ncbi:endonuclease-reverse transcriptase [Plakobranchus ocellatus]|uniref:Endonuclease-reverse transcriptase n=1 Tax=Plakobranchus ocellatus TaxID=259542 RepID=A0AAV4BIK4_9GAST|nr:endonuclease-reverse transcriptase [Plakobranchus ocellatus]